MLPVFGFLTEEVFEYVEFQNVIVKKKKLIQIRLKFKSLDWFSLNFVWNNLVSVYSRTKFELDKSKYAQVRQFTVNFQKILI